MAIRNVTDATTLTAVLAAYNPGDVLNFTYSPATRVTFSRSGNAGQHVTINGNGMVFPNGFSVLGAYVDINDVTVTPGSTSIGNRFINGQVNISGNYSTATGITVYGGPAENFPSSCCNGSGIMVGGKDDGSYPTCSHVTLTDCVVHNVNCHGIEVGRGASYTSIIGGEIYNYGQNTGIDFDNWESSGSTDALVQGVYIHGRSGGMWLDGAWGDGDGIRCGIPNLTIDGCTIDVWQEYDEYDKGHVDNISFDYGYPIANPVTGLIIQNCRIGSWNTLHSWDSKHSGSTGLQANPCAYPAIIRNNVIMCADAGTSNTNHTDPMTYNSADNPAIVTGPSQGGKHLYYNNVFYGKLSSVGSATLRNNIFIQTTHNPQYASSLGSDSDYNLFVGPSKPSAEGSHSQLVSTNAAVKWANAVVDSSTGYGLTTDWSLASDSPAKGTNRTYPLDVGFGTDMGVVGSIGAIQATGTVNLTATGMGASSVSAILSGLHDISASEQGIGLASAVLTLHQTITPIIASTEGAGQASAVESNTLAIIASAVAASMVSAGMTLQQAMTATASGLGVSTATIQGLIGLAAEAGGGSSMRAVMEVVGQTDTQRILAQLDNIVSVLTGVSFGNAALKGDLQALTDIVTVLPTVADIGMQLSTYGAAKQGDLVDVGAKIDVVGGKVDIVAKPSDVSYVLGSYGVPTKDDIDVVGAQVTALDESTQALVTKTDIEGLAHVEEAPDISSLSTFDPTQDVVSHVTLVDRVSVNDDMRGTDNALTEISLDGLATAQDVLNAVSSIISAIPMAGEGSVVYNYTLTRSDTHAPIHDAYVWVTSDVEGLNVLGISKTNELGEATFRLNAGTIYVWRQHPSYEFTNPDTEVVTP